MVRSQFHQRFMSCEFVRDAKASGFCFTCYKEKVEWDKLALVDLDRVVRDVDIGALQDHITTIVRCDLGELRGVDPGLIKLFRLAQLCLEYCIFCQEQLAASQIELEHTHQQTVKELESVKKELKLKKDDLKKEIKKRRVSLNKQEKENINTSTFQCSVCPKAFQSLLFLESHVRRRHFEPPDKEAPHDPSEVEAKLQQEVAALQLELEKQKDAFRAAVQEEKESQLADKETVWKKVEEAQSEQRARHQAEILELTQTFQTQLKQTLTSQQISPNDTKIMEFTHQKQLTALQDQLEFKREMEVQTIEELWKTNLETLENRHHSELAKLKDQLQILQNQGDIYLSELQAMKEEKNKAIETEYREASIKFVPKPARRRRHDSQRKFKEFEFGPGETANQSEIIKTSPKVLTPPSLLPRTKLQHPVSPQITKDTENFDSTPTAPVRVNKLRSEKKSKSVAQIQVMNEVISSSEEESTHEEVKTLQDMKAALRQNPSILHSLREDVAAHVNVKFAELGVDHDLVGISHQDFSRISSIISRHRKLTKKKFKNFENIRDSLEEIVNNRMAAETDGAMRESEPNIKPSKVKRTGFLAKLTQYHKRNRKKSSEPAVMHTSTPLKHTEAAGTSSRTPQSILKLSREDVWSGEEKSAKSEPSTPSPAARQVLERALSSQSLPPPKSVTFATSENPSLSSSWDDELPQQANKEFATAENMKSDFQKAQKELNEQLMLAFQTSASSQQKTKKPSSNDNSWDLEDL